MTAVQRTPVMLLHGAWLHASSWRAWARELTNRGFAVSTPRWPGEPNSVAVVQAEPDRLRGIGLVALTAHYSRIARSFDTPPVLIGHSVGGLIAQRLLAANLGRAAVALAPLPTGHHPIPAWAEIVRRNSGPPSDGLLPLSRREFGRDFANTVTAAEATDLFTRLVVPAPRRLLRDLEEDPARTGSHVDTHNSGRGPLLLISGQEDRMAPDAETRAMYKRYGDSVAVTDLAQFADRGHSLVIDSGWRAIAVHTLAWLADQGIRAA